MKMLQCWAIKEQVRIPLSLYQQLVLLEEKVMQHGCKHARPFVYNKGHKR